MLLRGDDPDLKKTALKGLAPALVICLIAMCADVADEPASAQQLNPGEAAIDRGRPYSFDRAVHPRTGRTRVTCRWSGAFSGSADATGYPQTPSYRSVPRSGAAGDAGSGSVGSYQIVSDSTGGCLDG